MQVLQRSPKILVGRNKYKCMYYKFKWRINPKCNTCMDGHFKINHLDDKDTFKWRPCPIHNTHMQGHFEITQPDM